MKQNLILAIVACIVTCLGLSACGQRGPLVLPESNPTPTPQKQTK
jgi:predicted small lipoprotein YifL